MVKSAPAQNTRGSALVSRTGTPGSAASASVSERSRLTSSALRRSGRDRRTQRKPAGLVSTTRWGCAMLSLRTAVDSRNARASETPEKWYLRRVRPAARRDPGRARRRRLRRRLHSDISAHHGRGSGKRSIRVGTPQPDQASQIRGAAMPAIVTDDGVKLRAEETGQGEPLLFVHEFAGDHRSWEATVRVCSGAYRCATSAARGYPPSDVPTDPEAYSQARAVADAIAVLDGLKIGRAHVVGLSMGGFTALHLALGHPERILSAVVAGAGYGAEPERAEAFRAESVLTAAAFAAEGAAKVAERYSLYAFADGLARITAPVLVLVGDEDEGCLEPALMLKRTIPTAGLTVLPRTGHTANLEEPDVFNRAVDSFLSSVARGSWHPGDPRARSASTTC